MAHARKEDELDHSRRKYARYKATGVCSQCVQRPAAEGHVTCEECRAAKREQDRERREARKAAGLCVWCGRPSRQSKATCAACHEKSKDAANERQKRRKREQRLRVITHYGGQCVCCGEPELVFLAIDHINGGGLKHLRQMRENREAHNICDWLEKKGYPEGFQVLCHNCNFAKHILGQCPHQTAEYEVILSQLPFLPYKD